MITIQDAISTKVIVQKLTNFAKFDLDAKIGWSGLFEIVYKMCEETITEKQAEEIYDEDGNQVVNETTT